MRPCGLADLGSPVPENGRQGRFRYSGCFTPTSTLGGAINMRYGPRPSCGRRSNEISPDLRPLSFGHCVK